jgi:hypothetical protein
MDILFYTFDNAEWMMMVIIRVGARICLHKDSKLASAFQSRR